MTPATAQWLPEEDQARYRKIWDATGVPLPDGGKFFIEHGEIDRCVYVIGKPLTTDGPLAMAEGFALAVKAGRLAYRAGAMEARDMAVPSTPVFGQAFV